MGRMRGAFILLCGRVAGLAAFANTPQDVMSGFKPYAWLAAVMCSLLLLQGQVMAALAWVVVMFCVLVTPLIIVHFLSERLGLVGNWCRYAAAFLWTQWVMGLLLGVVMVLVVTYAVGDLDYDTLSQRAVEAGGPTVTSGDVLGDELTASIMAIMQPLMLLSFVYMLWLQWFLARHALRAEGRQAALLAIAANVGTGLVMMFPRLLGAL